MFICWLFQFNKSGLQLERWGLGYSGHNRTTQIGGISGHIPNRKSTQKYGEDFFKAFKGIQDVRNKVKQRKEKAEQNKWLSLRGDSDLFYIDFDHLGSIIGNNWDIFKMYFPNQPWIITKIEEMSNCRNLIAHNSYISKSEKDLIKSYFNSILEQLDIKIKEKNKFDL